MLRKIVNVCLSTKIYEIDIDEFEADCRKFNHQFSRIFRFGNTPFKVHHLLHYAIWSFGPLFFYSTIRYERVHQLMKRLIRESQNFSTLPKQITTKSAILNLINESKKNRKLLIYSNSMRRPNKSKKTLMKICSHFRRGITISISKFYNFQQYGDYN